MVFSPALGLSLVANCLSGDSMELFAALNLEPIFQLTFLSLIVIAGPAIVFVLAFRGGDL
jgi:hypothetical protein